MRFIQILSESDARYYGEYLSTIIEVIGAQKPIMH